MNVNVIPAGSGEFKWVLRDRLRFLGGLEPGGLELVECEIPPGSGTPPHLHDTAEMLYVLEGEITVSAFPEGAPPVETLAGPGTAIRADRMAAHNYHNASGRCARMLVLVEPRMVAFFREIATASPVAEPDFAALGAAMNRHGIATLEPAA